LVNFSSRASHSVADQCKGEAKATPCSRELFWDPSEGTPDLGRSDSTF
jgi:hypothetical protein